MKFMVSISEKLLSASHNKLALGVLRANVVVSKHSPSLWTKINSCIGGIKDDATIQDITALPQVSALNSTYKALGKNPKQFKGSNEALLLRAKQDKGLYQINTVVDINNLISLQSRRSVGSYDLAKLEGNITFRPGEKDEKYPTPRDVLLIWVNCLYYRMEMALLEVLLRDSERALISENTTQLMTVIFSFDGEDNLEKELQNLEDLLKEQAKASQVERIILNAARPQGELALGSIESKNENNSSSNQNKEAYPAKPILPDTAATKEYAELRQGKDEMTDSVTEVSEAISGLAFKGRYRHFKGYAALCSLLEI